MNLTIKPEHFFKVIPDSPRKRAEAARAEAQLKEEKVLGKKAMSYTRKWNADRKVWCTVKGIKFKRVGLKKVYYSDSEEEYIAETRRNKAIVEVYERITCDRIAYEESSYKGRLYDQTVQGRRAQKELAAAITR